MNILDEGKRKCVGCGACVSVCNKSAISIQFDSNGFMMPNIKNEQCVACGLCKKVCIKYEDRERYTLSRADMNYAYSLDGNIRNNSSSGGIGYEIAKAGIESGYEVWGCIYDKKLGEARHICAHAISEIELFQGSKYLHSNLTEFYKELVAGKSSRLMLFALPCQVRAARNIIDNLKIQKNVILIDLFCRGVPSQEIWTKYTNYIAEKYDIEDIQFLRFRDKKYGWHSCQISITGQNNNYSQPASSDYFYKLYTSGLCFRDSCYSCKLKLENSYSDIRIGDYWGERFKENEEGVSLVILNSESGKKIWEKVKNNVFTDRVEFSEVASAQGLIYNTYSSKVVRMRKMLRTQNIQQVVEKMCRPSLIRRMYNSMPESLKKIYRHIKSDYFGK